MRAVLQSGYGEPEDVLSVGEVPLPTPEPGEVLVRVRAASLHADIWHVVTGRPFAMRAFGAGWRKPRRPTPGTDLAGTVVTNGPGATRFGEGAAVFGATLTGAELWRHGGTFAEYALVDEARLEPMPGRLSVEAAATLPTSGALAVRCLRDDGRLRPGHRLLVNGAGGALGSIAVQLGKAWGAHVTAVDLPPKLGLLSDLGADVVLDGAAVDFTTGAEAYDVVLDVPGNRPWRDVRRVVAKAGRYVLVGHDGYGAAAGGIVGSIPRVLGLAVRGLADPRLPGFGAVEAPDALRVLAALAGEGKLAPVVARTFELEDVAAAVRLLASGTAAGRVVLVP